MCISNCFSNLDATVTNYSHKPEVRYIHAKQFDSEEIYFEAIDGGKNCRLPTFYCISN